MRKVGKNSVRKSYRAPVILILLAVALLAALLLADSRQNEDYRNMSYTSYGVKEGGMKAFYLALEQYASSYDIEVTRHMKYARFIPKDSLILCLFPDFYYLNTGSERTDLYQQLQRGSSILILEEEDGIRTGNFVEWLCEQEREPQAGNVNLEVQRQGGIFTYETINFEGLIMEVYRLPVGGAVYGISNGANFVNGQLGEDSNAAVSLILYTLQLCETESYKAIVFDEFYQGIQESSVMDILGIGVFLFVVECLIAAALYFWYKGQRFGAPTPVPSIERRSETGAIDALSKLYQRTGSAQIAFAVHMDALIEDISVYLGLGRSGYDRESIIAMALQDPRIRQLGATDLLTVYQNFSQIRISERTLRYFIQKIETIRKEL